MRYALISDIHGNLEALEAVLEALLREKVDGYVCIGDIVGYGADPKACIRLVQGLGCDCEIAGNHEWGVLGLLDLDYFNEYAKEAILWTRTVLNEEELGYLRSFRLVLKTGRLTLVHGSLEAPQEFHYIFTSEDAYYTMKLLKTALCFVGHSHVTGIFSFDKGFASIASGNKIKIDHGGKYVVNIGSVGQPRDRDPRASFAIYDDVKDVVELRRVDYPIQKAQKKILDAGLPVWLAERISQGR